MIRLYSYTISPYAAKVRAILRYKGLAFEERQVHPLRRGEVRRLSGQIAIPILDDGGHVVSDSTRIARDLDERYPERPILPRDPEARGRALLLEEWADEALRVVVQPVRWLVDDNADRVMAQFRAGYPPGLVDDATFVLVGAVLRRDMRARFAPRATPRGAWREVILGRFAEVLDAMEGALAGSGWLLGGPTPTVADFAAWGFLSRVEGLAGWQAVEARTRVRRWLAALPAPAATTLGADAQSA